MTTSAERTVEPSLEPPSRGAPRSILAPRLRPFALALLVAVAAALGVLSIAFHGDRHGTSLDDSLARHLSKGIGSAWADASLHATDQHLTGVLLVLVALGALLARRWDIAVFATLSPLLAIFLTEVVLKPAVGRYLTYDFAAIALPRSGAFPSGHETGLAAFTVEVAILALRAPVAAGWRALVVVVLGLWTAVGAVGLTANLYHYATDSVGGVCVAVVAVLSVALVVDAVSSRFSSPAARSRTRTSRAA